MTAVRQSIADADAERRGALRHPVRMEGVLSGAGGMAGATTPVAVIDISASGCQIMRPAGLGRDTALLLGFGGFPPVEATVVWTSPDAAGLRFAWPVHPALIAQVVSAAKGRRRPARLLSPGLIRREERARVWHLALDVAFEDAAAPTAGRARLGGTLSDLSVDGCRIVSEAAAPSGLGAGTGLLLHIAGHPPTLGEVRWCAEGALGVEFGAPLPPGAVERIVRGAA